MVKKTFGKLLVFFRKKAGMTQQQLAAEANCAVSTVSRIENGQELPRREIFEKFNTVFERFGLTYEEIVMEEIFEFERAKEELLLAIQQGRAEEIERKLLHFKELMDEDNPEHTQYYVLAYLVYMRKNGMSVEEFLDRTIALFELKRKLPEISELGEIELSHVEDMMIYIISLSYYQMGDNEQAIGLLQGLMKNGFEAKTDYLKKRCRRVTTRLAEILVKNNEYEKAEKCISYVMERFVEQMESRVFFDCLFVQENLFRAKHDMKGVKTIDDFWKASERLINYLHHCYAKLR